MDHELEKQILTKTIDNLSEQLSQAHIELAYTKAQSELLGAQLQQMQQILQQLQQEPEESDEVTHTEAFAPGIQPAE